MTGISSLGIGSGLDLNALVKNLVNAQRAPQERQFDRREATLTGQLSAFGKLRGSISDLSSSLDGLRNLTPGRSVNSTNSSAVTGTASNDAPIGSFLVDVNNLASAQSLASDSFSSRTDPFGQGTLNITLGDGTTTEVVIGEDDDSLEGIRDAINNADIGVSAVIVNDGSGFTLALSGNQTGLDNRIAEISVVEDGAPGLAQLAFSESGGPSELSQTQAAADAQISVNGLVITSPTNQFTDVVDGVTINARAETTTAATVRVSENRGQVRQALQAFVEAFNAFNKTSRDLTKFDPEADKASILTGDSTVRNAATALRRTVTDPVGGDLESAFRSLAEIGITGSTNGDLSIDNARLDQALDENFQDVVNLAKAFGGNARDVAQRFSGSGGLISARTDGIQERLERITDARARLDSRIELLEARLTKQFAGLDSLLSDLSRQGDFLQQQLSNIPQPGQLNRNRR